MKMPKTTNESTVVLDGKERQQSRKRVAESNTKDCEDPAVPRIQLESLKQRLTEWSTSQVAASFSEIRLIDCDDHIRVAMIANKSVDIDMVYSTSTDLEMELLKAQTYGVVEIRVFVAEFQNQADLFVDKSKGQSIDVKELYHQSQRRLAR